MTEPTIDDGYAQAAAEDRAEARAVQYEQAQAEADEEARYLPTLAEPHPERYSYEAAENGEYPALCDDPDCQPCRGVGSRLALRKRPRWMRRGAGKSWSGPPPQRPRRTSRRPAL